MKVSLFASMMGGGGAVVVLFALAWFPSGSEGVKCYNHKCKYTGEDPITGGCPPNAATTCDTKQGELCVFQSNGEDAWRSCGRCPNSVAAVNRCCEKDIELCNSNWPCPPPPATTTTTTPTTKGPGPGDSTTPHSSAPPTGLLQPASKTMMMMTMTVLIMTAASSAFLLCDN